MATPIFFSLQFLYIVHCPDLAGYEGPVKKVSGLYLNRRNIEIRGGIDVPE